MNIEFLQFYLIWLTKMEKYIWEKQIQSIEGTKITFEDWTVKTYTEKQLSYIITDEPKDPTAFRTILIANIVPDLARVLEEHDIKKWDYQAVLNSLTYSYNNTFYEAVWRAFWTYEQDLAPEYFAENIRISDISRLRKS